LWKCYGAASSLRGCGIVARTQDERGLPKAITATLFFAAEIGWIPFQLSRKIVARLVLDLWFTKVVKTCLQGEAYLVRYIDDFVICF
jgi:hypothetical protein